MLQKIFHMNSPVNFLPIRVLNLDVEHDHGENSQKQLPSLSVLASWIFASEESEVSLKSKFYFCGSTCGSKTELISYAFKTIELEPCDHLKTSNLSADNFKNYSTSLGRYLSPLYGQVILANGYPVLTAVNWSRTISGCTWASKPVRKCEIKDWFPRGVGGRSVGRSVGWSVYGHVITKFSWMDKFS